MVRTFIILTIALIAAEGVRHWWFRAPADIETAVGERRAEIHFAPLSLERSEPVAWRHEPGAEQQEAIDGLLGHDRSRCGTWQNVSTSARRVHYSWVEYDAGNTRYVKDLFGHPPEVCAGKSGAKQIAIYPDRALQLGGQEIGVRHVEFADAQSGTPFQIFKFVWLPEDSPMWSAGGAPDLRGARLKAAVHRMPRCEARMMIAVVIGATTAAEGWAAFNLTVGQALRVDSGSAPGSFSAASGIEAR